MFPVAIKAVISAVFLDLRSAFSMLKLMLY